MGRYKTTMSGTPQKAEGQHPIWRGIGCITIIIVPVLSFAAASVSLPFFAQRGLIPSDLLVTPQVPDWLWISPILAQLFRSLFAQHGMPAILMLTFIFIITIGGLFSVVYAFMYRMVGPKRYGPLDAPPPKVKTKKYTR